MSNFTKLHLSHEIFRGLPAFSQFLWNLTFISSDCHEKFSLVSLPMTKSPSLGLKKCTKNAIFFKLFWYKAFVHWELKLLNFLVDSVLKCEFLCFDHLTQCCYLTECDFHFKTGENNVTEWKFSISFSTIFYKITKIVRAFWLVKNLWFIVPVNS